MITSPGSRLIAALISSIRLATPKMSKSVREFLHHLAI